MWPFSGHTHQKVNELNLGYSQGKKHPNNKTPQIKLQSFRKAWIWIFGWLVHQINSLCEVLKPKQNFRKNKVFTGKAPFFVIGAFCTSHSVCLNIHFLQGCFVWKCCVFNLSTFNWKTVLQFFEKDLHFSENLFQNKVLKTFKISSESHIKTCRSLKRRATSKIPSTVF